MISDCFEFHRLARYLFRATDRPVAITLGAGSLAQILDEKYYEGLEGGILEALGRLFKNDLRMYVYPLLDRESGELTTVESLEIDPRLAPLYRYLVNRGSIVSIANFRSDVLHIFSRDVLAKIRGGDDAWEKDVPEAVAAMIRERGLFGYPRPLPR